MVIKLSLNRDFTRFQNDETFPHKVTVYVGQNKIVCCGAIIAQQSSVLDRKLREDNGNLILEEMVDIGKHNQIIQCFNYLHGADLEFTYENIEVTMKFASWYEVDDLFEKCLGWVKNVLNKQEKIEHLLHFLKICDSLLPRDYDSFTCVINTFICANIAFVSRNIIESLHLGISGLHLTRIMDQTPPDANIILKKWTSLCSENKNFVLKNSKLFNFVKTFQKGEEFASFIAILSEDSESVETMKVLMNIQQDYFVNNNQKPVASSASSSSNDSSTVQLGAQKLIKNDTSTVQSVQTKHYRYVPRPKTGGLPQPQKPLINHPLIRLPTNAEIQQRQRLLDQVFPSNFYHRHNQSFQAAVGLPYNIDCEDQDQESLDVLVTNLPHSISKRKLIQLFKFSGQIDSVDIDRDDNDAVITFQDSESANKLINSTKVFVIDGHHLNIEKYLNNDSESENDSTDVYIGNIPPTATTGKLIKLFKFAGHISNVNIDLNDRSAVISFQDIQSANVLLDCGRRFLLDGYELEIEQCASDSEDEDNSTIYVGNIPGKASKTELKGLFGGFGKVTDVSITKKPGNTYGFVEFETEGSAAAAIERNTKSQFKLHGNILKVEMKR